MALSSIPSSARAIKVDRFRRLFDAPWFSLVLVLIPSVMDVILRSGPWPRWIEAILDETGHSATAMLLFLAVMAMLQRPVSMPLLVAALSGGVLIDVDHIPSEIFGWGVFTEGTVRPYSHSLTTIVAMVGMAIVSRRHRVLILTIAFGVATHLLRDLATNGVSLFWPLTSRNVELEYLIYLIVLSAAALVSAFVQRSTRVPGA
jgi:inner membrane protein